eukprot:scaffold4266_cov139-Skeletonema_menzelii.AAC.19
MGLAISLMTLPIGACVGCTMGPCITKAFNTTPSFERKCCSIRILLFPSLLIIGLIGFYIPLFLLCAKYDGVSVSTAMTEGSCWSTGGAMPYTGLGFAAGTTVGIGVTGCLWLIVALCRSPAEEKDQIQILRSVAVDVPVDVEQGSEAIVTDNVGGEQGQGSTVVATGNGEQASSATAKITVS